MKFPRERKERKSKVKIIKKNIEIICYKEISQIIGSLGYGKNYNNPVIQG